jgi:alpha-glucosidase
MASSTSRLALLLLLAAGAPLAGRAASWTPTPHGCLVSVAGSAGGAPFSVELAVEGLTHFRVSVLNSTAGAPAQVDSPMVVAKAAWAAFSVAASGNVVNLTAPGVGSVSIDASSGAFALAGPGGAVLTRSARLVSAGVAAAARRDTCANAYAGFDAANPQRSAGFPNGAKVASQAACCAACNGDSSCTAWVYDTQADSPNCWPLSNAGGMQPGVANRVLGAPPPPPALNFVLAASDGASFLGAGTDGPSAQTMERASAQAQVFNTGSWTPSFWSSDGWSVLAVSPLVDAGDGVHGTGQYPVSWARGAGNVTLSVRGADSADLYLAPAPDLRAHVVAQAALEGRAALLPRYAFAFWACRWGWVNQSYIEGVLAEFRSGSFPLDNMISDFEWYTPKPDYSLPPQGDPNYRDFTYNNVTWPPPAAALISRYRAQYNVRFGGIRKPRLGNSDLLVMARQQGWLMGQGGDPAGAPDGTRNLNYSRADVRTWYSQQNAQYLKDGVLYFWNDEGEDDYFTFTWWNQAEIVTQQQSSEPTRRFISINRAFAPGAARLGAVTWTGDISPQWLDLQRTPGYAINWGLAGQPLVTCDIGGFSGESNSLLLARWYALGVFLPVMRVHSTIGTTPHFPFPELWGAEASAAMRQSLDLRYRLLPHTYSLAHFAARYGVPIVRPMQMGFPADPKTRDMTAQFLFGEHLLVAPVLTPDNATSVYLPAATWFEFESSTTHEGPATLALPAVPLGVTPAFVQAGSIVPLAPRGLQFSDALPGGPLEVTVYTGADARFEFYDDDGETTDWATAPATATSTLALAWSESSGCLSWTLTGAYVGPRSFTQLSVTAYVAGAAAPKTSPAQAIGASGSACPK